MSDDHDELTQPDVARVAELFLMDTTPGPWRCSRPDMASYRESDGSQVSYVYFPDSDYRVEVATKNCVVDAQIMSAARDMLQALIAAALNVEGEAAYLIRGAISKAIGWSP